MASESSSPTYDAVIIGAGMSGIAAAIRLGMYGLKVLLVERHEAPGGLNSFYRKQRVAFDVGLHALTNFVPEGAKGAPLQKVFRQLRIQRADFDLAEQKGSSIRFPGRTLRFNNQFEFFREEVIREFPHEQEHFDEFVRFVREYHAVSLDPDVGSAREEMARFIRDQDLVEMLLCPLMYYGSAREHDMDFGQCVVLFQALFLEGFSRPFEGVRRIIRVLLQRAKEVGVERRMRKGVKRLHVGKGQVQTVEFDDGETVSARWVVSSAGAVETLRMCSDQPSGAGEERVGRLSFAESIAVLNRDPVDFGLNDTIVFFNHRDTFEYARPDRLMDFRSGVVCVPNHYAYSGGRQLEQGLVRVTSIANAPLWEALGPDDYLAQKALASRGMMESAARAIPGWDLDAMRGSVIAEDMFTPCTIHRYTGHLHGAVYGAPEKVRDGRTPYSNLLICGTDQGFLGIVGAMLSGISIVNFHILKGS